MGKNIRLLGFDNSKAQLLLHFYLYHNGGLGKYQAMFNCPHCGVSSILSGSNMTFDFYFNQDERRFFISCIIGCINHKCQKETVIIEHFVVKEAVGSSLYDFIKRDDCFNLIDQNSLDIEVVYPTGDYARFIDYGDDSQFVPKPIIDDFIEIQKVSYVSPKAALVLSRRLLEKIILDKFPDLSSEDSLFKMIEKIKDNTLSKDLMNDIRVIGNNTIHVSNPNIDIILTNDDSALAIHVIDDLLHEFYITPGKKNDRRKRLSELRKHTNAK